MSDYTKTTNFTAKDALTTGDPLKVIKGSYFDTEFDNIATAVATKYDSNDLSSQAQAEAGTNNTTIMTPLRTEQWSAVWAAENGGMVGDIHGLADPGADQLLGWDDSAGAVDGIPLASDSGLAISATPDIAIDISSVSASFSGAASIAGADLFLMDNGAGGTNTKIAYQDFGIPVTDDSTTTPFSAADLTYANRWYSCSNASAISLIIPANASVAYPIGTVFYVYQAGAGQVTVSVTSDTLRSPNGAKTSQQYALISVTKVAATTWVVTGDTSS
jgi:hypothetical protein